MSSKKISTTVPAELLSKACKISNLNQTDALIEGLRQLIRSHDRKKTLAARGSLHFDIAKPPRERARL